MNMLLEECTELQIQMTEAYEWIGHITPIEKEQQSHHEYLLKLYMLEKN